LVRADDTRSVPVGIDDEAVDPPISLRLHDDFATTATLLDGSSVTIRRLLPGDYDAVVALEIALTAEERYLRFFTTHPTYVGEWALSLTRPEPGLVALGVFETGELIGVANFVGMPEKPGYAEVAVVVAHEQHKRGVGTVLLRELGRIARNTGQHHFVAEVLADNNGMRQVINDAGWPITQHRDGPVLSVEVNLDDIDEEGAAAAGPAKTFGSDRGT
jgi:RimJ/RimL family protein N-acetyltransferase